MRSFLAGLFTGSLIGVVVTLLILLIVTGFKGSEPGPKNKLLNPRVYLVAIVLLAICAVCYTFDLVKDAMLAFMVSVSHRPFVKLKSLSVKPTRARSLVIFKRKPEPLKLTNLLVVCVSHEVNDVGDAQALELLDVRPG
jgi:hypothetical protein